MSVNAGKTHEDIESVIATLENILIKRRKNITQLRYLAFLKRLTTLSLQLLHNGSLGCMGIVKNAIQLNSALDILLDTENKVGSGKYDPIISDPEFSNSNCTSLFELTLLKRHYHTTVSKMARYILSGCQMGSNIIETEVTKLQPLELYVNYNSNEMSFKPPVLPPVMDMKQSKSSARLMPKLRDFTETPTTNLIDGEFNFFEEFEGQT